MGLKDLFVNMTLVSLLILGVISFIIVFQNDNSVSNPVADNDLINKTYGNLLNNISDSRSQAQTVSGNFDNSTPVSSFGEVEVTSIFSTTNTLKALTIGSWNVLIVLPASILGVSPVVFGTLGSILLLLVIMGIWAGWKAGLFGGNN